MMIDTNVYKMLGDELGAIAEDWDAGMLASGETEIPGDIRHHHKVALAAFQLAVFRNEKLPLRWLNSPGSAAKNGVSTFASMAYIKAAAAGYSEMERADMAHYMTSDDGIRYTLQAASGPGLVSERTRTDFGISTTPTSLQADYELQNGGIFIKDNELMIPRFNGVRLMHSERAEEKGLDMTKRCVAMQQGAFKPIFNAINILSLNSGAADATYDKFVVIKQTENATKKQ